MYLIRNKNDALRFQRACRKRLERQLKGITQGKGEKLHTAQICPGFRVKGVL